MNNMVDKINSLLNKIGKELAEKYQYILIKRIDFIDNKEKDNSLKNISVFKNKDGDYFIFFPIDFSEIDYLSDEYQIYLNTYIEEVIVTKYKDFILSDSFNKNRSLILITQGETSRENRQIIAEIEEDPYFFKKQILLLNENEIEVIPTLLESESIIDKCNEIISDSSQFIEFKQEICSDKIDKSALYSLVAKLYEKLPFLTLNIRNKRSENLTELINKNIDDENLIALRNELIKLETEKDIDDYIKSLINIKDEAREDIE